MLEAAQRAQASRAGRARSSARAVTTSARGRCCGTATSATSAAHSIGAFRNITARLHDSRWASPLVAGAVGHVARPGAGGALRPGARPLPLPLVLGLLRRPDDEPAGARDRHRPVGHRRGARAGRRVRAAPVADRLRRDAGRASRRSSSTRRFWRPGRAARSRPAGKADSRSTAPRARWHQPPRLRDRARQGADAGVADPDASPSRTAGRPGAVASHRGGQGRRLRAGARPVPAARPQLPRRVKSRQAAGLRSRRGAPDVARLPPGQHRRATWDASSTGTPTRTRSPAIRRRTPC